MTAGTDAAGSDESELVRLARGGDLEAFDRLVRTLSPRVFRFLLQFVRNRHDAEDLTQTTFLRAHAHLDRFDPTRPMINWLLTIARRCALNHFRAARPWRSLSFADGEQAVADEQAASPDRAAENRDNSSHLWDRARERLSERGFEALWLRFGEDLSVSETARVMGLSPAHVKILVFRAKHALRKGVLPL
ncbi:MAG TPA: sigma-70 family RNA polymerase sigma factor [Opitutaceae bacterium]|jgi:RNA polymerase sigma-70 factor (ECF subfamily)